MRKPKPVCIKCSRFYAYATIGVEVVERAYNIDGEIIPYLVWHADVLRCPGCGHEIVGGYGAEPTATKSDEHFEKAVARATYRVMP